MGLAQHTVVIIDDEKDLCELLSHLMKKEGCAVYTAEDGRSGIGLVKRYKPDVVLLDIRLPDLDGIEVMQRCKQDFPHLPVVLMTAYAEVKGAIEAMKRGAHDYLTKPLEHQEVLRVMTRAITEGNLKRELATISSQLTDDLSLRKTMGPSDAVNRLLSKVTRVAASDFTVIIYGETGSGKELVARAIHHLSPRSGGPFVAVDCGALQESLLESELFGHEKGAFTGAHTRKTGKFELARKGTLLLDEISNMTLGAQATLLRAIQEKMICPVGGTEPLEVDVRLLVSCNQNLESSSNSGAFRSDLYYRLDEFTIKVPPLRERKEDIGYLAERFLQLTNMELGKSIRSIQPGALEKLTDYDWPGNVRQLRSIIRRGVLLADSRIEENHIELPTKRVGGQHKGFGAIPVQQPWQNYSLKEIVQKNTLALERDVISQVLQHTGWNKAEAARLLRVDYKTLHGKIKRLELTRH